MLNCATCGTVNADDATYCRACATRLSKQEFVSCRHCGQSNLTEALYCSRCGGTLLSPKPIISSQASTIVIDFRIAKTPAQPQQQSQKPDSVDSSSTENLVPVHELLRMANARGIDIDYSTLRFWQKRGLVAKPLRGPTESGRGTRGYYDLSVIDRLGFIREIQKVYSLGLDAIHDELLKIDQEITGSGNVARVYHERLANLQSQREAEGKRTLINVVGRVFGVSPDEIAIISLRKKDGQTWRIFTNRSDRDSYRNGNTTGLSNPEAVVEYIQTANKLSNLLSQTPGDLPQPEVEAIQPRSVISTLQPQVETPVAQIRPFLKETKVTLPNREPVSNLIEANVSAKTAFNTNVFLQAIQWQIAKVLAEQNKLFVLWSIHQGFYNNIHSFQQHFDQNFPIANILQEFESNGFCYQRGGVYFLTPLGEATIIQFEKPEIEKPELPKSIRDEYDIPEIA